MLMDERDEALLALLRDNSRASTAELARKLSLSRSTVKDRIARLEQRGIITGYTVRFSTAYSEGQIQAHVMISSDPKHTAAIIRALRAMPAVRSLHAVNGIYDMIAFVSVASTRELDEALDAIGAVNGVDKTLSSIILSTKFER